MPPPTPIRPPKPPKPINDVLAANLQHFMDERNLSQASLAAKANIGQTTVSLYLNPSRRKAGASGKVPSAKLAEVEQLAAALNVQVWELLRDLTAAERELYQGFDRTLAQLRAKFDSAPALAPESTGIKSVPRKRGAA